MWKVRRLLRLTGHSILLTASTQTARQSTPKNGSKVINQDCVFVYIYHLAVISENTVGSPVTKLV